MTTKFAPAGSNILTAGDPGWDEARLAWNLAADQQPAAIARPASAEGVAAAIAFARQHGLRVAAQATGHNAVPLGPLAGTVLIRTAGLHEVTIDPEQMTARAGAGVLWQEVADAAAHFGLAGLAGSSPDVGVAGYTLGGGMSLLSRRYGLAASNVTAIEAVTAGGQLVRADATHEPDLFWALRGGGGSFAVVTALEQRLFPVTELRAGLLWWPAEAAQPVLQAWRALTEGELPDEFTTTARLIRFPDDPDVPDPVRGHAFVIVDCIFLGSRNEAAGILAPLRALRPVMDTVGIIPARELGTVHLDPAGPVAALSDGLLLDRLPAAAIDELIRLAGPAAANPPQLVEIRHLGGEIARRRRPGCHRGAATRPRSGPRRTTRGCAGSRPRGPGGPDPVQPPHPAREPAVTQPPGGSAACSAHGGPERLQRSCRVRERRGVLSSAVPGCRRRPGMCGRRCRRPGRWRTAGPSWLSAP